MPFGHRGAGWSGPSEPTARRQIRWWRAAAVDRLPRPQLDHTCHGCGQGVRGRGHGRLRQARGRPQHDERERPRGWHRREEELGLGSAVAAPAATHREGGTVVIVPVDGSHGLLLGVEYSDGRRATTAGRTWLDAVEEE